MIWIILSILSAILLGIYDIFKKISLTRNAVLPVLFFSSLINALLFIPVLYIAYFTELPIQYPLFQFSTLTFSDHLFFALKSVIVGSSWTLAYYAMKYLPITIVSPIRSSGPLWTLLGAVLIFGEKLTFWQWMGLTITLIFYYLFSLSGKKEGISFRQNRWIFFMTLSTIIGSISSLYDKFLVAHYNRLAMQAWYHVYMVPLMLLLLVLIWYPTRHRFEKFEWRWSIPLISLCLTFGDFIYFWALSYSDSLIAIVSTIRRGSVVVSFTIGAMLFKEKNILLKGLILLGILAGIAIIVLSSN
ncbi:MAG: DMT family transporter [Bacteroidales bacterium]|nr:DMT family transporter [Bacteroidales bacterium]